ncbi:MAG: FAD-dependent monooxygenase, partial [Actinomycetia bacterium]|nr:FAD-dependent monooxygenase [Actinomycetes bacterium]
MENILKCDVLIIGAGPAGASLSLYLAEEGIDTILIDKKS